MTASAHEMANSLNDSARAIVSRASHASTRDGEWSPTILLGHLSDVDEEVWLLRLTKMVQAQRAGAGAPLFVSWEPDEASTLAKHGDRSLDEVCQIYLAGRAQLTSTIDHLSDDEMAAVGSHSSFGEITISDIVRLVLSHDAEHAASLRP